MVGVGTSETNCVIANRRSFLISSIWPETDTDPPFAERLVEVSEEARRNSALEPVDARHFQQVTCRMALMSLGRNSSNKRQIASVLSTTISTPRCFASLCTIGMTGREPYMPVPI